MSRSQSIDRLVMDTAIRVCEAGRTPRCLTVAILIRYGEWDQLASLRVEPLRYLDRDHYFRDCVATEFLRKFEPLPTSIDREAVAREAALAAEKQCYKTNERLSPYLNYSTGNSGECEVGVQAFIRLVRKKVAKLLGPLPSTLQGRFGSGATFADRGQLTTVPDKMNSAPTMTRSCDIMRLLWAETAWGRACYERRTPPVYTRGNRFTTVPKDATKHRGIAVEPSINVFYQLAVGAHLKRRLYLFGLDNSIGQDKHKQLACAASITSQNCTIDLSSASDTISYNLVKLLLPEPWFDLLDTLRCSHTFGLIPGRWLKLEKFSSMGNGFTFELETLLFACIVSAACESNGIAGFIGQDVFTYGDDIICPNEAFHAVKVVLEFFGMELNERKSFHEGYFRESCGGDFWGGADVRPFHLKKDPDAPEKIISLLNGLNRLASKEWITPSLAASYRRVWLSVLDWLPTKIRRCRGPESLGDIVIHDSDESRWDTRTKHSIRYLRVWRPVRTKAVKWEHFRPETVLASALFGCRDTLTGPVGSRKSRGVVPRDAVISYGEGWVAWS